MSTTTSTVAAPPVRPVVWAMMVVLVRLVTVAFEPPMVTVAPAAKFVPVIVTSVPPLAEPELGVMAAIVGTEAAT